jgi:Ser/Thr protein kinase RdoA (MazF antagonist)
MVNPVDRQQATALRHLGLTVLDRYGLRGRATLRLLRHEHNTTFRVDADGERFVLRINRAGVHRRETIASEMAWLAALRADTALGVPTPVAATDGALVVSVRDAGGADRHGVLLAWQRGRFVDERLIPTHLGKVGRLQAGLQLHAVSWTPPAGFVRPRVDTLTNAGKRASIAGSDSQGRRPTDADADAARQLVDELLDPADLLVVDHALERSWATTAALDALDGGSGLIHADLHYENFLFDRGRACAIDFDDCGWGFHLYDLAVTLWELQHRDGYLALRDALLTSYADQRPLPTDHFDHLDALMLLRRLQSLLWILESREHPAFADWRAWADEELDGIRTALSRLDA